MKSLRFCLFLFVAALLLMVTGTLLAADLPAAAPEAVSTAPLPDFGPFPGWIVTALAALGALRVVVKPLVAAFHYFADQTLSDRDNRFIDSVERSAAFRGFLFVLDWLTSIKVRSR